MAHLVIPAVAEVPSGGDVYNRRAAQGLHALGWQVRTAVVPGSWPHPDRIALRTLRDALAALPDGALVLLDGIIACCAPEILIPHAHRLRTVVLVHLPLARELGLPAETARDLHRREGETLRGVGMAVVPSRWVAGHITREHDLRHTAVRVVAPGVDPAPVAPGFDGATNLLSLAAVTPTKGQDLIVDGLARVGDLDWHWRGVGARQRAPAFVSLLEQRISEHGIGEHAELPGPRVDRELAAALATADLLVVGSRTETFGMVITEALARGVPVVAFAVGGIPEALGKDSGGSVPGMLVQPEDPAALADALRVWLENPLRRSRLRASALDRRGILNSWEDTARRLADALRAPG